MPGDYSAGGWIPPDPMPWLDRDRGGYVISRAQAEAAGRPALDRMAADIEARLAEARAELHRLETSRLDRVRLRAAHWLEAAGAAVASRLTALADRVAP